VPRRCSFCIVCRKAISSASAASPAICAWWAQDRSAGYTAQRPLPPTDVTAAGSDESSGRDSVRCVESEWNNRYRIILVTDADATIDDPPHWQNAAKCSCSHKSARDCRCIELPGHATDRVNGGQCDVAARIRVYGQTPLKSCFVSALPDRIERTAIDVSFTGALAQLPLHSMNVWNRTWMKQQAIELAATGQGSRANSAWSDGGPSEPAKSERLPSVHRRRKFQALAI